jgi:anti-sigma B factor antagonist
VTEPPLNVALRELPSGHRLLSVDGELDHYTAPQVRAALDEASFGPGSPLIIDLTGLTYCDSTGITVLVIAHQQAQAAGASLTLAGLSPELTRVFEIVGLDQLFAVQPTVADAVEAGPVQRSAPGAS